MTRRLSVACVILLVSSYALVPLAGFAHAEIAKAHASRAQHDNEEEHSDEHERGLLGFLGEFHPFAVHFPIALLVIAGVAELFSMRTNSSAYAFAARFMLYTAAIASVAAALLGLAAAAVETYDGFLASVFSRHRVLGLIVPPLTVLTAGMCASANRTQKRPQRTLYRVLLIVTILAVLITGYLGSILVHD